MNIEVPLNKFLIILSRLSMVYFVDICDIFLEKAYCMGKVNSRDSLRCCALAVVIAKKSPNIVSLLL